MQVICNTEDFQITEKTAVTLGKFDGIHKGHQRLLNALLEKKKQGLKTVVFTFFVPPIPGCEDVRQLTPNDEKKKFLEAYGIDYLIEYPFTEKVRHTAPKDFIREILCKKLCAAFVAAGPDFCFGYERKGNVALLEKMSSLCGYEFEVFDKVSYKGEPISSSRIRACISEGQMEDACEMLDRPFSLIGTVIHGKAIGHTIGFATMNLVWPEDKLLVPIGVYLSKVKIGGNTYQAITNVGHRPTVEKDAAKSDLLLEAHLLQYSQMAYGEEIEVSLFHYERPEVRFSGLDALKEQLKKDTLACVTYFEERGNDGKKEGFIEEKA